ncbi:unnamed protein product [Notodromas monacha]|uniref:Peptidase S1 domain-containing protein n=1 Tax=Notodromas monacha TaxID=399045 RepID=A0A7R9BQ16_9CRUS|nr:unnamed protein product [Notodromas monacha]CAG0919576.1 unnamed protein product [Notodromas monacha]
MKTASDLRGVLLAMALIIGSINVIDSNDSESIRSVHASITEKVCEKISDLSKCEKIAVGEHQEFIALKTDRQDFTHGKTVKDWCFQCDPRGLMVLYCPVVSLGNDECDEAALWVEGKSRYCGTEEVVEIDKNCISAVLEVNNSYVATAMHSPYLHCTATCIKSMAYMHTALHVPDEGLKNSINSNSTSTSEEEDEEEADFENLEDNEVTTSMGPLDEMSKEQTTEPVLLTKGEIRDSDPPQQTSAEMNGYLTSQEGPHVEETSLITTTEPASDSAEDNDLDLATTTTASRNDPWPQVTEGDPTTSNTHASTMANDRENPSSFDEESHEQSRESTIEIDNRNHDSESQSSASTATARAEYIGESIDILASEKQEGFAEKEDNRISNTVDPCEDTSFSENHLQQTIAKVSGGSGSPETETSFLDFSRSEKESLDLTTDQPTDRSFQPISDLEVEEIRTTDFKPGGNFFKPPPRIGSASLLKNTGQNSKSSTEPKSTTRRPAGDNANKIRDSSWEIPKNLIKQILEKLIRTSIDSKLHTETKTSEQTRQTEEKESTNFGRRTTDRLRLLEDKDSSSNEDNESEKTTEASWTNSHTHREHTTTILRKELWQDIEQEPSITISRDSGSAEYKNAPSHMDNKISGRAFNDFVAADDQSGEKSTFQPEEITTIFETHSATESPVTPVENLPRAGSIEEEDDGSIFSWPKDSKKSPRKFEEKSDSLPTTVDTELPENSEPTIFFSSFKNADATNNPSEITDETPVFTSSFELDDPTTSALFDDEFNLSSSKKKSRDFESTTLSPDVIGVQDEKLKGLHATRTTKPGEIPSMTSDQILKETAITSHGMASSAQKNTDSLKTADQKSNIDLNKKVNSSGVSSKARDRTTEVPIIPSSGEKRDEGFINKALIRANGVESTDNWGQPGEESAGGGADELSGLEECGLTLRTLPSTIIYPFVVRFQSPLGFPCTGALIRKGEIITTHKCFSRTSHRSSIENDGDDNGVMLYLSFPRNPLNPVALPARNIARNEGNQLVTIRVEITPSTVGHDDLPVCMPNNHRMLEGTDYKVIALSQSGGMMAVDGITRWRRNIGSFQFTTEPEFLIQPREETGCGTITEGSPIVEEGSDGRMTLIGITKESFHGCFYPSMARTSVAFEPTLDDLRRCLPDEDYRGENSLSGSESGNNFS